MNIRKVQKAQCIGGSLPLNFPRQPRQPGRKQPQYMWQYTRWHTTPDRRKKNQRNQLNCTVVTNNRIQAVCHRGT